MGYVLYWYLWVFPIFCVQIVIAELLCVHKLRKRKKFLLRLALSLLGGFAFVFLISVFTVLLYGVFAIAAISYFLIFTYTVFAVWFCFEENFFTILFFCVAAYSMQNLGYRAFGYFELYGVVASVVSVFGKYGFWAYKIFEFLVFAAVYAALYFLFIRKMQKSRASETINKSVLIIATVTLGITILLCGFTNTFSQDSTSLLVINYLFSIICCVFVLSVQSGIIKSIELRKDLEIIKQSWDRDRKQYELSKESVDRINFLCHDLKHKIKEIRLEESGLSKEELKELESVIKVYDGKIKTGSEALDVILTEKSLYCNKNDVRFTCMADGEALSFMKPSDLYSLFGNVLSNAVEAVLKIKDEDRRVINLTVRKTACAVIVSSENFYDGEIKFKNGLPQTDKEESYHGFGMKSVKLLVENYGGSVRCFAENGVFKFFATFPFT